MVRRFVDTSALLALLDDTDAHHLDAAATMRGLDSMTELVTHNYVVIETIALVRRRLGSDVERRLFDDLLPVIRVVWVDAPTHRAAFASYRARGRSASLVDHVSFEVMRATGLEVAFTFDTDFEAEGFKLATASPSVPRRLSETPATYAAPAPPDLVSIAEISARAGRPINTIQSWRRRHRDFPAPLAQLAAGPIWAWSDVKAWIDVRGSRPLRALPLPPEWRQLPDGSPMPDVVRAIRLSRSGR